MSGITSGWDGRDVFFVTVFDCAAVVQCDGKEKRGVGVIKGFGESCGAMNGAYAWVGGVHGEVVMYCSGATSLYGMGLYLGTLTS